MNEKSQTILETIMMIAFFIWLSPVLIIIAIVAGVIWLIRIPARKCEDRDKLLAVQKLYRKGTRLYLDYDRNHSLSEWIEDVLLPRSEGKIITNKYRDKEPSLQESDWQLLCELSSETECGGCAAEEAGEAHCGDEPYVAILVRIYRDGHAVRWEAVVGPDGEIDHDETKLLFIAAVKNPRRVNMSAPTTSLSVEFKTSWSEEMDRWYEPDPDAGFFRGIAIFINHRPLLDWLLIVVTFCIGCLILYYSFTVDSSAWAIFLRIISALWLIEAIGSVLERIRRHRKTDKQQEETSRKDDN